MISPPTVPQIVAGAKSSTTAPLCILRESWRATNPTEWNGFLLLFFKLWALFRWLKILEYLYFEGRVKVVLKYVGSVCYICFNSYFQFLINIIHIFIYFFTLYFQGSPKKVQTDAKNRSEWTRMASFISRFIKTLEISRYNYLK